VDTNNTVNLAKEKKQKFETQYKRRIKVLIVFLLIALFVLIGRLYQLHVVNAEYLRNKAEKMRQQSHIHTYRGEIRDRNGIVMASDISMYDIYAHPQYYKEKDVQYAKEMAQILSPHLNQPVEELTQKLSRFDLSTITLARKVDKELVRKIKQLNLKGLDFAKVSVRKYPQGLLASHILGYYNSDADISAGVENTGTSTMVEVPEMPEIQIDGTGEVIYDKDTNVELVTSPPKGESLVLTIDSRLQHLAELEIKKMVEERNADKGAVVMLNPKNGEVIAFAVYPSYDPNKFREYDHGLIKNWALTDVYPPGSTFKIFTIAAGLESGAITKNSIINDTGKLQIQGWTISNYDYYKNGAPGNIDLNFLLEHSSNVASAKISLMIDPKKHRDILSNFGIGTKTGIDIPGESAGILLPIDNWDQITRATIGFGYGIASTPMQMASAVASIANDGVWITPHVIKYPETVAKEKIKQRRVLSERTAKTVKELLKNSITNSKAIAGKIPNYYVAGKTGTSRKPNPNGVGYIPNCVYTSFVGFFPADDPELLIMVVVDNPKGAEVWGNTVAGPVFNNIAVEAGRYLNIKKDKPEKTNIIVSSQKQKELN
jgi:cell division protein FtsI/penicillin-binding protein 2